MLRRVGAGLLLAGALAGCDAGGPAPPDPAATVTAQAADAATVVALQHVRGTFAADENATATAGLAEFARIKPSLAVTLRDAGAVTEAGVAHTAVQVGVTNHDSAGHHLVIRLFERAAPLSLNHYSVGALDVAAGSTVTTTISSVLPFAAVAAQIQQIDTVWDFSPPAP